MTATSGLLVSSPRVIGHPVDTPNGRAELFDLDQTYAYVIEDGRLVAWPEASVTAVEEAS